MEALNSWQALLKTLGAQEQQHRHATPHATGTRSSAAAARQIATLSPGSNVSERYYSPQPSSPEVHTAATPVDAWYSILSTLQGGVPDGRATAVHLGSPNNSSTSPTGSSPGMIRQLFPGSPNSTKLSTGAAQSRLVAASTAAVQSSLPVSSSTPQHTQSAAAASPADKLHTKLGNLRSSAEQLKSQLGLQLTGTSSSKHTHQKPIGQVAAAAQSGSSPGAATSLGARSSKQRHGTPLSRKLFATPGKGLGSAPLHLTNTVAAAAAAVQRPSSPGRLQMSSPIGVHPPVSAATITNSSTARHSTAVAVPGAAGVDGTQAGQQQDQLVNVLHKVDELLLTVKQQRAGTAAIQQQQQQQQLPRDAPAAVTNLTSQLAQLMLQVTAASTLQQQQGELGNPATGYGPSPQAALLLQQQQVMLQLLLHQHQQLLQQQQQQQGGLLSHATSASADVSQHECGTQNSAGDASEQQANTAAEQAVASNIATTSKNTSQTGSPQQSLTGSPGKQIRDEQQQQQLAHSSCSSSNYPRAGQSKFGRLQVKLTAQPPDCTASTSTSPKAGHKQQTRGSPTPKSPSSPAGRATSPLSPLSKTGSYALRLQQQQQQSSPRAVAVTPKAVSFSREAAVRCTRIVPASSAAGQSGAGHSGAAAAAAEPAAAASSSSATAVGMKSRRQWTVPTKAAAATATAAVKVGEVAAAAAGRCDSASNSRRGSDSRGGGLVSSDGTSICISTDKVSSDGSSSATGGAPASCRDSNSLADVLAVQQQLQRRSVSMSAAAAVPSRIPRAPDVQLLKSTANAAATGKASAALRRSATDMQHATTAAAAPGLFSDWLAATAAAAGGVQAKPANTYNSSSSDSRLGSLPAAGVSTTSISDPNPNAKPQAMQQQHQHSRSASSSKGLPEVVKFSGGSSNRSSRRASITEPSVVLTAAVDMAAVKGGSSRSSRCASITDPAVLTAAVDTATGTGGSSSRVLSPAASGTEVGLFHAVDSLTAESIAAQHPLRHASLTIMPNGVQSVADNSMATNAVTNSNCCSLLSHSNSSTISIGALGSFYRPEASFLSNSAAATDIAAVPSAAAAAEASKQFSAQALAVQLGSDSSVGEPVWSNSGAAAVAAGSSAGIETSGMSKMVSHRNLGQVAPDLAIETGLDQQQQQHNNNTGHLIEQHTEPLSPTHPVTPATAAAAATAVAAALAGDLNSEAVSVGLATPAAALPRVHTPGKSAAATAADVATPMLAHSTAAVLHMSAAWREESGNAQARWSQLLEEWSADDLLGNSDDHSTELLTRQSSTCLHRQSTSGYSATEDQASNTIVAAAATTVAAAASSAVHSVPGSTTSTEYLAVQPATATAALGALAAGGTPASDSATERCGQSVVSAQGLAEQQSNVSAHTLAEQQSEVCAESSAAAVWDFSEAAIPARDPTDGASINLQQLLRRQKEELEQQLVAAVDGAADAEQQSLAYQLAQQVKMIGQLLGHDAADEYKPATVMNEHHQQQQQQPPQGNEKVPQQLLQQQQQGKEVPPLPLQQQPHADEQPQLQQQQQADTAAPQQSVELQGVADGFFSPGSAIESEASELSLACLAVKAANQQQPQRQQQQQAVQRCAEQPQLQPPVAMDDHTTAAAAAAAAVEASPVTARQLFTADESRSSSPRGLPQQQQQLQQQPDLPTETCITGPQQEMPQQQQQRRVGSFMALASQVAAVAAGCDQAPTKQDATADASAAAAEVGGSQAAAAAQLKLAAAAAHAQTGAGSVPPTPASTATAAAVTSAASVQPAPAPAATAAAVMSAASVQPATAAPVDTEESFSRLLHSLQDVHDKLAHEAAYTAATAVAVASKHTPEQTTAAATQTEAAAAVDAEESFNQVLQDLQDVHDRLAHEADYAAAHAALHAAAAQSASAVATEQSFNLVLHDLQDVHDKLAIFKQQPSKAPTPTTAARQKNASAPGAVAAGSSNSNGSAGMAAAAAVAQAGPAQPPAAVTFGSSTPPLMYMSLNHTNAVQAPGCSGQDADAAAAKQSSADKRFAELRRRLQESRAALSAINTPSFPTSRHNASPPPAAATAVDAVSPLALPASAWLQATPLQQLLRRNKTRQRLTPTATAAADGNAFNNGGTPGAVPSMHYGTFQQQQQQQDGTSSVQVLVNKWRAKAANTAWQAASSTSTAAAEGAIRQQQCWEVELDDTTQQQQKLPLVAANTPTATLAAARTPGAAACNAAAAASPAWLQQVGTAATPYSAATAATPFGNPFLFPMSPLVSMSTGAGAAAYGSRGAAAAAGGWETTRNSRSHFVEPGSHSTGGITAAAAAGNDSSMQPAQRGIRGRHLPRRNTNLNPLVTPVGFSHHGNAFDTSRLSAAETSPLSFGGCPADAELLSPLSGGLLGFGHGGVANNISNSFSNKWQVQYGTDKASGQSPLSTSTLQQWVREGSPTRQLKQRVQAAAQRQHAHRQQQQQHLDHQQQQNHEQEAFSSIARCRDAIRGASALSWPVHVPAPNTKSAYNNTTASNGSNGSSMVANHMTAAAAAAQRVGEYDTAASTADSVSMADQGKFTPWLPSGGLRDAEGCSAPPTQMIHTSSSSSSRLLSSPTAGAAAACSTHCDGAAAAAGASGSGARVGTGSSTGYVRSPGGWLSHAPFNNTTNTTPTGSPAEILAATAAAAEDAAACLAAAVGPVSAGSRLRAARMQQAAATAGMVLQQLQQQH